MTKLCRFLECCMVPSLDYFILVSWVACGQKSVKAIDVISAFPHEPKQMKT